MRAGLFQFLTLSAVVGAQPPASVRDIPITVLGHIIVHAEVEGRTASLVLDPIAGLILDERWARANGLAISEADAVGLRGPAQVGGAGAERRRVRFLRSAELRVGPVADTAQRAVVALDSLLAASIGHRVDGLLGLATLRGYIVELSATMRRMRLHARASFQPPDGAHAVPVRYDRGIRPIIDVQLTLPDGRAVVTSAYFDLGMSGTVRATTRYADVMGLVTSACRPEWPAAVDSSEVGLGGSLPSVRTRLRSIRVGPGPATESIVVTLAREREGADASPPWDVLVGWSLMRQWDWWFDVEGGRLWMRRNTQALPPDGSARAGLEFEPMTPGPTPAPLVVASAQGAAERAGIQMGDTLVRLENDPVAGHDAELVRSVLSWDAGRTVTLVVRRDSVLRRVFLKPEEQLRYGGCVPGQTGPR